MTQSNFQGKAQPPQPCGFKIQPPGSHCQLALSLGFVTVLALTSSPSKFGPPHLASRAAFTKSRQIYIYIPGFIKRLPEPGPAISPDPDFRPSPGPLFVEDLMARVVRAQPPASGLLAGIKLNSLVSNLGGACQIEILQFRQGGGGGGGGGDSPCLSPRPGRIFSRGLDVKLGIDALARKWATRLLASEGPEG